MFKRQLTLGFGLLSIFSLTSTIASANPKVRILEINGFIGSIEVITSPNAEFLVKSQDGKKFKIQQSQNQITGIISIAGLDVKDVQCNSNVSGKHYKVQNKLYKPEDFPKVTIFMPSSNGLRIKNSVLEGIVGNIGGAAIDMPSCGKLSIGNIAHSLEVRIEGATDITTGNIGEYARFDIEGASSIVTGDIGGEVILHTEGAGNLKAKSANGAKIHLEGVGNVKIEGGKGAFDAKLDGAGNIDFRGTAINPKVSIEGIGNVSVKEIIGQKNVSIEGLGKFTVK